MTTGNTAGIPSNPPRRLPLSRRGHQPRSSALSTRTTTLGGTTATTATGTGRTTTSRIPNNKDESTKQNGTPYLDAVKRGQQKSKNENESIGGGGRGFGTCDHHHHHHHHEAVRGLRTNTTILQQNSSPVTPKRSAMVSSSQNDRDTEAAIAALTTRVDSLTLQLEDAQRRLKTQEEHLITLLSSLMEMVRKLLEMFHQLMGVAMAGISIYNAMYQPATSMVLNNSPQQSHHDDDNTPRRRHRQSNTMTQTNFDGPDNNATPQQGRTTHTTRPTLPRHPTNNTNPQ